MQKDNHARTQQDVGVISGRKVMITIQMVLAAQPTPVAETAEDDAVLVKRAVHDLSVFTELYQRHADRVYRYLLIRVSNVHDAQDLTSQTFLAAMENLHRYRGKSPFGAWLLGIARHKSADHFRQRRPEETIDTVEYPSGDDNPADIVSQQLQMEQVARKLRTLSPDRAEAISLRIFGGLEVAEIALMMGKSEASIRMLVFRGLRDLQEQLNPEVEVGS